MNNYRIIVYNVELTELEKAIQIATTEYEKRYECIPHTLAIQPSWQSVAQNIINAQELQMEIDRFPASPGTIQIGK